MSENNPGNVHSAASDSKARTWIAAFVLSFLVTACSTPGWEVERPSEGVVVTTAESAFARGDYAEAAAAWESDAMNAPPGHAPPLQVSAADAWLLAGDPTRRGARAAWR